MDKSAKDHIQDARTKLMNHFGIFGGGHALNTVFDSLNTAWEMLPESSPVISDDDKIPTVDMTLEEVMNKFGLVYKDSYNQPSLKEAIIKSKIEERKLCIYLIESDLLDHEEEEQYAAPYIMALKDEIENHNNYIAQYTEELNQLNK